MDKRFLYIYVVSILFATLTYAEIKVEISLDKYEFLEAEPIIYRIIFTNKSNSVDSINYYAIDENFNQIEFSSIDSRKILIGGWTSDFIGGSPYRRIESNQKLERIGNLLEFRGDKKLKHGLYGAEMYLSEGVYKIKYSYNKQFESNEITINIIKPQKKEIEVFNKLLRAYQINDGNPWIMDSILLKKEIYYDIVVNNPESIYWEEAVNRYNEESNWLKLDYTDIYVNKEFVQRFPNSLFLRDVLINLCQAIYLYEGGTPAVSFYLNYLIENYQNYSVSAIAKEQLEKKEYLN